MERAFPDDGWANRFDAETILNVSQSRLDKVVVKVVVGVVFDGVLGVEWVELIVFCVVFVTLVVGTVWLVVLWDTVVVDAKEVKVVSSIPEPEPETSDTDAVSGMDVVPVWDWFADVDKVPDVDVDEFPSVLPPVVASEDTFADELGATEGVWVTIVGVVPLLFGVVLIAVLVVGEGVTLEFVVGDAAEDWGLLEDCTDAGLLVETGIVDISVIFAFSVFVDVSLHDWLGSSVTLKSCAWELKWQSLKVQFIFNVLLSVSSIETEQSFENK